MSRSFPSIVAALFSLTFAAGCPADSGDTDTDTATVTVTDAATGTDAGTDAGTTAPTTGEPAAPTCTEYCTSITAACSGANLQYTDMAACMGSCEAFELGAAGAADGNTVGCRSYHAGVAGTDAASATTHCIHAGPSGAGVCGSNCESFCTLAADICSTNGFADAAACTAACDAYDDTELYDAGDASGDTFACRLYHLTAATADAATHCPHILPDSAPCK